MDFLKNVIALNGNVQGVGMAFPVFIEKNNAEAKLKNEYSVIHWIW